ncbi:hypothetical protein [Marinisporobacter balticus]|uniref:Uncharacterized protein n=1 Tax=Marinisporobacter balticus TaxID=2018667 RepID=A0A4R2KZ00_9FIRM|nr:hypothetical protein [Marinisporobacter balticus]TCO79133.1 hypothetical protein EV214_103185 [Marinisporobacter balticus]
MKPTRKFTADDGDFSTGLSGPDTIEIDIDTTNKMFDSLAVHANGEKGGIKRENLNEDLEADIKALEDRSDTKDKEIQALQEKDTVLQLQITSNDDDITTLQEKDINLQRQIENNDIDISNLQNSKADKLDTYTKTEIDEKETGIQNQIISNDNDITTLQAKDINLQNQIRNSNTDISNLQTGKSDKANTYTQANVDDLLSAIEGVGYTTETLMSLKALINNTQNQLNTLNDTFSTDAERIKAINDVINQFEIADTNINAMLKNKANKTDVYTKSETNSKVWGAGNLADRCITGIKIGLLQVKNENIQNGVITAEKLAATLLASIEDIAINVRFEKLEDAKYETVTNDSSIFSLNGEKGQLSECKILARTYTNLFRIQNLQDSMLATSVGTNISFKENGGIKNGEFKKVDVFSNHVYFIAVD